MSVTTKERLLEFMAFKGISRTQLYNELSIKRGLLDSDKLKATVPDTIIAKILVTYTELNLKWLLTGEGPMLRADDPPTNSVTPSTDAPAASAKPDESILYNMYKDLQAEKEKIRLEKEAKIEELNAKMLAMSEEIGRLKAKLGEEESEDQPKDISKKTAKNAFTKPHSSQSSPDAPSAGVPSGGR